MEFRYLCCPCGSEGKDGTSNCTHIAGIVHHYGVEPSEWSYYFPCCGNHIECYRHARIDHDHHRMVVFDDLKAFHNEALKEFRKVADEMVFRGDLADLQRSMTQLWNAVERAGITLETSDFLDMAYLLKTGTSWGGLRTSLNL